MRETQRNEEIARDHTAQKQQCQNSNSGVHNIIQPLLKLVVSIRDKGQEKVCRVGTGGQKTGRWTKMHIVMYTVHSQHKML